MKKYFVAFIFLLLLITNLSSTSHANWQAMNSGTTSYLVSVFFIDSMTGFIGGQNGFLSKTTNGGNNWTVQDPIMASQFVRDISFVNPNTGFVCGDDGLIRKTTDGGLNWIPQSTGTSFGIYSIDAVDDLTIFATVTNGSILRSTDGGSSYTPINLTSNQLLSIDFSSRDTGYTAGQGGVVYKTTNNGLTWSFLNASTLNNFWDICALSNDDLYLCAYYGTIRKTNDGGNMFKPSFGKNRNFEGIKMLNNRIGYTCGLDGVINKTTDGSNTWEAQISNTTESLNEIFFLDTKIGFTVGTNGTVLKTTDGGDNFSVAVLSPNNREVLTSGTTIPIQWSSVFTGNARIEYSIDNGASWTVIQNSVPAESFEYNWLVPAQFSSQCKVRITSVDNPSISDASDGNFRIVPLSTLYNVPELVYYKFNDGSTTTPNYAVPGEIYGNANIIGLTLQNGGLADSSLVGGGGNGTSHFVNTNWATYLPETGWTIGFWLSNISLGVDPNNAVYLFGDVTANNLRCYYGGSGGLTPTDTAIMFRCGGITDVRIPVVQGQTYYIHIVYEASLSVIKVYKNGVLFLTQPQNPFLAIGNGPLTVGSHATFNSSLALNMRMDEFRIYNRSLSQNEISNTHNITLPSIITGFQNLNTTIPNNFKLYNNYPNPFNPKTVISYQLAVNNFVILKVYDVMGKEISTIVNQKQNSGSYHVEFDGSNFSSGVYFYKIEAGSFTDTKRMILLK